MRGKKEKSREDLLKEWFEIQISPFETIKAPVIGQDNEANEWLNAVYELSGKEFLKEDFFRKYEGEYVIRLAKELDGIPVYSSAQQDANVFRGEFLRNCADLIGDSLVNEAWTTKLADETLDYGNRMMKIANLIAVEKNLQFLRDQRNPPESDENSIESKLHIIYSLSKWLIFYGKNGHGYEADI
ncbi:hypothetical protein HGB47_14865 [Leptospira yasudae]|nr:hypothetical protein [Leptospira yasudae]